MGEGQAGGSVSRIVAMREHGHPVGVIAQRFGLTYAQVYDVLAEAHIADDWMALLYGQYTPPTPGSKEEREVRAMSRKEGIVRAYQYGWPVRRIWDEFQCSSLLMYAVLSEAGIPRRRRAYGSNGMTDDQRRQFRKLRYTGDMTAAEARVAVGASPTP